MTSKQVQELLKKLPKGNWTSQIENMGGEPIAEIFRLDGEKIFERVFPNAFNDLREENSKFKNI